MILLVVYYLQDGIVGFVRKVLSLGRVRVTKIDPADLRDAEADAVLAVRPEGNEIILDLRGILMQFGGLKALNDINLTVRRGTHPRPDRTERLGQEHDDERADRHLRAERGIDRIRRPVDRRADFGEHRAVGYRADVPERAVVRRDDGAGECAGRPASHLQVESCRRGPDDGAISAGRAARARARVQFAALRRAGGRRDRRGAESALRQAAVAGDRAGACARPAVAVAR